MADPARSVLLAALAVALGTGGAGPAAAFRIIDAGPALASPTPVYVRWDAAPREVAGVERSLDGGLRYSLEGGSYEAFRDQLSWDVVPTAAEFEDTVTQAFAAWMVTDPATGLGTSITFAPDFATEVYDDPGPGGPTSWIGLNDGAEIDIMVAPPHIPGAAGSALAFVDIASFHHLTLTSGTTGYEGFAIAGSDIRINPALTWSLAFFRRVLTHEIGHALGFADFEQYPGVGGAFSPFLDDNYDGTSSATAYATLTNSFALEIDPLDPDSTPLLRIASALYSDPGLLTPGVDMLMESSVSLDHLTNNDFAGRQFLYPVPEPSVLALLFGVVCAASRLRPSRQTAAGSTLRSS